VGQELVWLIPDWVSKLEDEPQMKDRPNVSFWLHVPELGLTAPDHYDRPAFCGSYLFCSVMTEEQIAPRILALIQVLLALEEFSAAYALK
jgi:hypothetical protein